MAILRQPIICKHCGHPNHFIMRPITEYQKLTMWCGDQGGDWPTHCEKCEKPIYHFEGPPLPPFQPSPPTSTAKPSIGESLEKVMRANYTAVGREEELPQEILEWINKASAEYIGSMDTEWKEYSEVDFGEGAQAMYHHLQKVIEGYIQSGRNIVAQNESLVEERDRGKEAWRKLVEERDELLAMVQELTQYNHRLFSPSLKERVQKLINKNPPQ